MLVNSSTGDLKSYLFSQSVTNLPKTFFSTCLQRLKPHPCQYFSLSNSFNPGFLELVISDDPLVSDVTFQFRLNDLCSFMTANNLPQFNMSRTEWTMLPSQYGFVTTGGSINMVFDRLQGTYNVKVQVAEIRKAPRYENIYVIAKLWWNDGETF